MHTIISIILFIFLINPDNNFRNLNTGDYIPEFSIKYLDGRIITQDSLAGKFVFINLFSTKCEICVHELIEIEQKIWGKYKSDDIEILCVGRDHTTAELKEFSQKYGLTIPMASDSARIFYNKFAQKIIPRNYIIDRKGIIIHHSISYSDKIIEIMSDIINKSINTPENH